MNRLLVRFPALQRIGVQIALFVTLAIVATILLMATVFVLVDRVRGGPPFTGEEEELFAYTGRIVLLSSLLDAAPPVERDTVLALALGNDAHLRKVAAPPSPGKPGLQAEGVLPRESFETLMIPRALALRLPDHIRWQLVAPTLADSRYPDVVVSLTGDLHLRFSHSGIDLPRPPPPLGLLIAGGLAILVTSGLLIAALKSSVIAPLERLAAGVARAGGALDVAPFVGEGAMEVRRLAAELNGLRDRQREMMTARTEMLAAVGHDLRTPLTRLRLRAEEVEADTVRADLVGEIDRLSQLTDKALAFLRGEAVAEPFVRIDVASLVASIADGFAELGRDVALDLPPRLVARCQPDALARAIGNLVENAFKFGRTVSLRLAAGDDGRMIIEVADDGPGIDEALRERLQQPFVRGDDGEGRGDARGGFGLGLAIARRVAIDHGGDLLLTNRQPHGLVCRLSLPVLEGEAATG
ncbi:sensor histidine kinase [Methylobrevis pamukkalensis]|uniref:histidine kinase n=1 Tax=Methylobrevis pamukkalensis TaxID=1439726 RepID=A0A1E3H6A7_9HYPH|nr:ATP-binding protein [Methylobrevis pamukkalensis]ODN71326.1 Osmolarity sensor protein EnvZ [Methylobrevis pamukkalensis]